MSTAKVIAKEGLYVRSDRNRKSTPVRTMAYGEEFEFIEEYKGWLAVEDGWVKLSDAWVKPVEMSGSAELPFGEETVFSIEWDGNTEGLVFVETEGGPYYKVSDELPNHEDILGATLYQESVYEDLLPVATVESGDMINSDTYYGCGGVYCIPEAYTETSLGTFEVPGVYFVKSDEWTVYKLEKTAVTTIDPKFLPDPLMLYQI